MREMMTKVGGSVNLHFGLCQPEEVPFSSEEIWKKEDRLVKFVEEVMQCLEDEVLGNKNGCSLVLSNGVEIPLAMTQFSSGITNKYVTAEFVFTGRATK